MKIVDIVKTQRFPDGSTSGLYKISFDNPDIKKTIQFCGSRVGDRLRELFWLLGKAKTEAVRDELCTKHGTDWRIYETEKTVLLEEEKLLLKKAIE